jgi:hypothetical protein
MKLLFWVMFALAVFTGMGTANADTHIYVGGTGDCTSQLAMATADPANTNIPVVYPTCPNTIDGGVAAATQAWNANCVPGPCTLEGVSLGAAVVSIVGQNVGAGQPDSSTSVVTDANPWGEPGLLSKPSWLDGIAASVTGSPPGTVVSQVPGSVNRFNVNDLLADGGGQSGLGQFMMLLDIGGAWGQPGHSVPVGQPVNSFVTSDGVTQDVFGSPLLWVSPPGP